jgi:4-hydroxybutyrate dehydrogenase / sulfolactaldehyde 3-reductase
MERVGFIGLGVMGNRMAQNILKGGYPLTVYDINPAAVEALRNAGAETVRSPQEVGKASDVVVTMLPEPQDVEQVVLGPRGVVEGIRSGGIVIEMSTIDPATSQRICAELKKREIAMIDAPVGKTSEHAASGTLTLMLGGNMDLINKVKPILACMGSEMYYCGGHGMGHAMKMVNNLLATAIMVADTEAMAIGVKAGLTVDLMVEVMKTTMAWNAQLGNNMTKKAFMGDDSPGFMIKLACKDVRLAVTYAGHLGIDSVVGRVAQTMLDQAVAKGYGDRDTAALMFMRESDVGIKVRLNLDAQPARLA